MADIISSIQTSNEEEWTKFIPVYHDKGVKNAENELDKYFNVFIYFMECEFDREKKEQDEKKMNDYSKIEHLFGQLKLEIDPENEISGKLHKSAILKINKKFKQASTKLEKEFKAKKQALMIRRFNAKQALTLYIKNYETAMMKKEKEDKSLQLVPKTALIAIKKKKQQAEIDNFNINVNDETCYKRISFPKTDTASKKPKRKLKIEKS